MRAAVRQTMGTTMETEADGTRHRTPGGAVVVAGGAAAALAVRAQAAGAGDRR